MTVPSAEIPLANRRNHAPAAHVGNLCSVRLERLFCYDCPSAAMRAGDEKRVSDWTTFQSLLFCHKIWITADHDYGSSVPTPYISAVSIGVMPRSRPRPTRSAASCPSGVLAPNRDTTYPDRRLVRSPRTEGGRCAERIAIRWTLRFFAGIRCTRRLPPTEASPLTSLVRCEVRTIGGLLAASIGGRPPHLV